MVIEGIKTTIPLHLKIMDDPKFQAGEISTALYGASSSPANAPEGPATGGSLAQMEGFGGC